MEDVAKYEMADGQIRAQYMIANQTTMDTKIVLRKAGYTGAGYREQYEGKATGTYPIIEMILYWEKERGFTNCVVKKYRKSSESMWMI